MLAAFSRAERVTLAKILADIKDAIRHKRLDSALIITVKHPRVLMSVWSWLYTKAKTRITDILPS